MKSDHLRCLSLIASQQQIVVEIRIVPITVIRGLYDLLSVRILLEEPFRG
jgi:hypothetical protein